MALNMTQFMMNSLIPKYTEHLGATAVIVGMVSSMFAFTALGVRPIVGPATGYFKKHRLLAVSVGFIILAFVCYGVADSIPMIVAGRLLHGIGMGFLAPVSLALASDALPDDKIASGIGIFSLGQAAATAIGPSVGLALVDAFGYHTAFFTGAALMVIVLVLTQRLKSEEPRREGRFRISVRNIFATEVWIPTLMMFFLGGAYSCIGAFILIFGLASGVDRIGLFFTAYAVCLVVSRPLVGKVSDRFGLDKAMIPGIVIYALSFVVISFSHSLPMFLIAGVISAFGYGVCHPTLQTLCMKLVTKERRGVAGNTSYIGMDVGFLLMPTLAGSVVTAVQHHGGSLLEGYSLMFRVMTIPIFIALVIYLMKRTELMVKLGERPASLEKNK